MKKQLKFTLALALSLALLFSLGAAAFADTAEDGLPLEYVSYGVGLPDPAPVDMHELGAEDITLEGVSYDARTEDGHIYIRLSDLAAAKLLRESRDKAAELGLDYAKIYIADGVIFAKDTGNADEVKEVQGLISALKQGAAIGISVDDIFDLGNAGDVKLHVKIRGFAYGDAGSGAAPASSGGSTGEKRALDVKALDMEKSIEQPEVTTVYFYYYGLTGYDTVLDDGSEWDCYSEGEDGGDIDLGGEDGGDIDLGGGDEEEPVKPDITRQRAFMLSLALAYSQKDIDDGVQYYVWINGENIKIPPLNSEGEWLDDEGSFLAKDASGKTGNELLKSDIMGALTNKDFDFDSLPTVKIKVTTDAAGNNVVKTIDFNNVTPKAEELLDYNMDSNSYVIKDAAPEGYKKDTSGEYNAFDPSDAFVPEDKNMDVPDDAIDNSDVTIDVRDDIIFDDLEPKKS